MQQTIGFVVDGIFGEAQRRLVLYCLWDAGKLSLTGDVIAPKFVVYWISEVGKGADANVETIELLRDRKAVFAIDVGIRTFVTAESCPKKKKLLMEH